MPDLLSDIQVCDLQWHVCQACHLSTEYMHGLRRYVESTLLLLHTAAPAADIKSRLNRLYPPASRGWREAVHLRANPRPIIMITTAQVAAFLGPVSEADGLFYSNFAEALMMDIMEVASEALLDGKLTPGFRIPITNIHLHYAIGVVVERDRGH